MDEDQHNRNETRVPSVTPPPSVDTKPVVQTSPNQALIYLKEELNVAISSTNAAKDKLTIAQSNYEHNADKVVKLREAIKVLEHTATV